MSTDNNLKCEVGVKEAPGKCTYTVSEIASMLQIGKSKAYELCHQGCFQIIRIGKAVRVSKASFDNWLNDQNK